MKRNILESATVLSFANHANGYIQTWSETTFDPSKLIADAKQMGLNSLLKETASDTENLSLLLHYAGNNEIIANFERTLQKYANKET